MFDTIKTYALIALGAIAAVFGFLWQMVRAKHANALKKGVEEAREVEQKDIKATIEGLENENKAIDSDIKPDHFK